MTIQKVVAREWLYLLGFAIAGGCIAPLSLMVLGATLGRGTLSWKEYADFLGGIGGLDPEVWVLFAGPYIAFQLVRSVLWAVRVSRKP
jgi:hypothetical protein